LISGWQKTTFIDYPGKIASTIFIGGCNFRCPYCHNKDLVRQSATATVPENLIFKHLEKIGLYDGVCVSGGEPLLSQGLEDFLQRIKELGLLVKIDTNGSSPEKLKRLVERKLIDYVAIDVKGSLRKYQLLLDDKIDQDQEEVIANVAKSIRWLIKEDLVDYEVRSTLYPPLFILDRDIVDIGLTIYGAKRYYLQQFNQKHTLLDTSKIVPFSNEKIEELREYFSQYVQDCSIR